MTDGAPRGFPGDFPRPADAGRVLAVDLTTTDRVAEVVAFYRAAIDDAGFVLLFDDADNLRFETDEYVGDVLVTAADGSTAIVLTATLPDG